MLHVQDASLCKFELGGAQQYLKSFDTNISTQFGMVCALRYVGQHSGYRCRNSERSRGKAHANRGMLLSAKEGALNFLPKAWQWAICVPTHDHGKHQTCVSMHELCSNDQKRMKAVSNAGKPRTEPSSAKFPLPKPCNQQHAASPSQLHYPHC